jgi:3-methylcrotonyl-CoA carboxylase alpha subunit
MFKKILIANRGEIACRIARTCRAWAWPWPACIPAPTAMRCMCGRSASRSAWAAAAPPRATCASMRSSPRRCAAGAEAIHPGYGFLAENPEFARAVEAAGLVFIGPTPEVIERLGNKASAKAEARAAGVAVLGSEERPAPMPRWWPPGRAPCRCRCC